MNFADYSGMSGFLGSIGHFIAKAVKVVVIAAVVVGIVVLAAMAIGVAPELGPAIVRIAGAAVAAVTAAVNRATPVLTRLASAIAKVGGGSEGEGTAAKAAEDGARASEMQAEDNTLPELGGETAVPTEANQTLQKIDQTGESPYYSKGPFKNLEQRLPLGVNYTEHDIYEMTDSKARGLERLVTGDDGSAWYTKDHYRSFERMR